MSGKFWARGARSAFTGVPKKRNKKPEAGKKIHVSISPKRMEAVRKLRQTDVYSCRKKKNHDDLEERKGPGPEEDYCQRHQQGRFVWWGLNG